MRAREIEKQNKMRGAAQIRNELRIEIKRKPFSVFLNFTVVVPALGHFAVLRTVAWRRLLNYMASEILLLLL